VVFKRGQINTSYQKRMFVLEQGKISYYKVFSFWDKHTNVRLSSASVKEALERTPDQLCGTIQLTSLWSVRAVMPGDRDYSASQPHCFHLTPPASNDRIYKCKAPTADDCAAWVQDIKVTLDGLDNKGQPREVTASQGTVQLEGAGWPQGQGQHDPAPAPPPPAAVAVEQRQSWAATDDSTEGVFII